MSTPLTCNLAALPPAQRDHHAATSEALLNAAEAVHVLPDGVGVRLPVSMLALAADFIEHERLCCPFLHLGLEVQADGAGLWLRLTSDDPAIHAFLRHERPALFAATAPPLPIAWCAVPIPAASIPFRNERGEVYGTFMLRPFAISQTPVTYHQFEAFVNAPDGWSNPIWWAGLTERYQHQPRLPQRSPVANHPADMVSWYQAVAYTRWLHHQHEGQQVVLGLVVGENALLRLPYEWEWQWAAQGSDARRYPWGEAWEGRRANTRHSRLGATTPVDRYPLGAAACGALDMCGNVWEWCLNPYADPADTRVAGHVARVLRGGSFADRPEYAVGAARFNDLPNRRLDYFGFRVVVGAVGT